MSRISRTKRELQSFDCENKIKEFKDAHTKDRKFRDVQLKQSRTRHENNVRNQGELLVNHLRQTIIDRFGPLNDGNTGVRPEMSLFSIFDVGKVPGCDVDDISQYGKAEISKLVCHFHDLLPCKSYEPEKIEEERVSLWDSATTTSAGRIIKKFWPKVLRKKGNSELRNILSLVKILLVLIYSTACVERGFSLMNRVKPDCRCKLKEESLNDLMHVAPSRITVKTFNPEPAIEFYLVPSLSHSVVT